MKTPARLESKELCARCGHASRDHTAEYGCLGWKQYGECDCPEFQPQPGAETTAPATPKKGDTK